MKPLSATQRPQVPRISCVMPAYNEAANLSQVIPSVLQALADLSPEHELIVVDDGSDDATASVVTALARQHPQLVLLRLSRNFGKEAALAAGLGAAAGDVVILMDSDGQHPVDLLPTMLRLWRDQGADNVYAVRRERNDQPRLYSAAVSLFYRVINWGSRFQVPANASDFRLLDRRVVDVLLAMPEHHRFTKGLYAWAGFHSVAVPYDPLPRAEGKSRFGWRGSAALGATGLLAFTTAPLRLFGLLGLALALASLGYGIWIVLDHFIRGAGVPGWATLATAIMFLSGIQLLSLGLVAEYVARIYDEVKRRPLYWVAERVGHGLSDASPSSPSDQPGQAPLQPSQRDRS